MAFVRGCPQYRHLSRTFPVAEGRTEWPLHWVVIYGVPRVPDKQGLLLRIDAATGEVLERAMGMRRSAPRRPESMSGLGQQVTRVPGPVGQKRPDGTGR